MQIDWTGLLVFAAFCLLLGAALSRPDWMPAAEGIASVLILLALGAMVLPRVRKNRGA